MVLPSLAAAGMEVMVARCAAKLARRGHEVGVTCIVERGQLAEEAEASGVRVTEPGAQGFANPRWLPRLSGHFRVRRPDVVHIHSGAWLKGALAARAAGVPRIVYTAHGFVPREGLAETVSNRVASPLTHAVVAVSEHLAQVMRARGLAGRHLCVIENGIDIGLFRPRMLAAGESRLGASEGELRRRLGIGPSTMLLGTVARLEPIKNQAMLIEGLALARAEGIDCACVLIGEGSQRPELEALASRLGIASAVHFWGLERHVARLYPELDVFALTSNAEGTSISLLEAMASGVCPLATNVGGNPAVVGEAGVLVEARRSDALAEAIRRLAADPDLRRQLGEAARKRVVAQFSDEAMVDRYEAIYRA